MRSECLPRLGQVAASVAGGARLLKQEVCGINQTHSNTPRQRVALMPTMAQRGTQEHWDFLPRRDTQSPLWVPWALRTHWDWGHLA